MRYAEALRESCGLEPVQEALPLAALVRGGAMGAGKIAKLFGAKGAQKAIGKHAGKAIGFIKKRPVLTHSLAAGGLGAGAGKLT